MTTNHSLPFQKLVAWQVAKDLLGAVVALRISDTGLRDQAERAAKSVCLNVAEAAGRTSPADQKRVFGLARGETSEVAAAVEVAAAAANCNAEAARRAIELASREYALLTGLIRR